MRQVFFDTETTGLHANQGDRVIELGCLEMVNRELTGRSLHLYFQPDRESSPEAVAVHGITSEFLSDKPRFEEKVDEIIAFFEGAELIAHNAEFDVTFLDAEMQRAGKPPIKDICHEIIDTLALARELFPGKRNSLDALCERYEISNSHRTLHGALIDADLLAQVWLAMTRGQFGLEMVMPDSEDVKAQNISVMQDPTAYSLKVIKANEQELLEHAQYLMDIKANEKMWSK